MKKILFICVISILLIPFVNATAATLNFDDLTGYVARVPDGYGGLDWDKAYISRDTDPAHQGTGYISGIHSGSIALYSGSNGTALTISSDGVFNFESAYFTAAYMNNLTITITGYLDGSIVDTESFTVNWDTASCMASGIQNIDQLVIESSGGTLAIKRGSLFGDLTQFVMDDFSYTINQIKNSAQLSIESSGRTLAIERGSLSGDLTQLAMGANQAVPVPGSLLLLSMGLAGMAARRKQLN